MNWSSERLLALVAAIFLVYAFGVLIDADSLTRPAGIAAALALVAYAAVAGLVTPPRVRWPLLLAAAGVSASVYLTLPAPASGTVGQVLLPADDALARQFWQNTLAHARWTALLLLLTAGGLAIALLGLPRQRRPWAVLAAIPVVVLLLANTAGLLPTRAGGPAVVLEALWLPLLAAVASVGVTVLATQRGHGGWRDWLAFLGVTLLALVALGHALATVDAIPSAPTDAFLAPGIRYSAAHTVTSLAVEDALTALAMLVGPLLVVVALSSARSSLADHGDVDPNGDQSRSTSP